MGNNARLQANNNVQATVFGPTPLKLDRNCLASSRGALLRNERSSDPRRLWISFSSCLMRIDFCFASPPDLIAASIEVTRARLAASQVGNLFFRLSNARLLLALVVLYSQSRSLERLPSLLRRRGHHPRFDIDRGAGAGVVTVVLP